MLVEYDQMPIKLFSWILNPASENTYYCQIIFMYPETLLVKYNIILDVIFLQSNDIHDVIKFFKTFLIYFYRWTMCHTRISKMDFQDEEKIQKDAKGNQGL